MHSKWLSVVQTGRVQNAWRQTGMLACMALGGMRWDSTYITELMLRVSVEELGRWQCFPVVSFPPLTVLLIASSLLLICLWQATPLDSLKAMGTE
jgi:hypothetical protein